MSHRLRRGLAIYAVLVLSIASCRAWQVHSAPIDCADSEHHGPDPGSSECRAATASERERRPQVTEDAFLAVIIFGGLGLGAFAALRLAMRVGRRLADSKDSSP